MLRVLHQTQVVEMKPARQGQGVRTAGHFQVTKYISHSWDVVSHTLYVSWGEVGLLAGRTVR